MENGNLTPELQKERWSSYKYDLESMGEGMPVNVFSAFEDIQKIGFQKKERQI